MKRMTLLFALALCACSRSPGTSVMQPTQSKFVEAKHVEASSSKGVQLIEKTTWTMSVPANWVVLDLNPPPNADPFPEFKARAPSSLGRGPIQVSVNSATLDEDMIESSFGEFVVGLGQGLEALQIIVTSSYTVAHPPVKTELPASLMAFVAPGNIVAFQLAVGYRRRGYFVRCIGDAYVSEEVAKICQPIITSFVMR